MKTKSKDQKIFNKFNKQFKFIFNDAELQNLIQQHFNKNGSFVSFLIGLMMNRVDEDRIKSHLKINAEEWIKLFSSLYLDKEISQVYENIAVNAAIDLNEVIPQFKCFDSFIDSFIAYLKQQQINLNIRENDLRELISNAFGYILYNSVECKMYYHFDQILNDPEYDSKLVVISNNTKLFAKAKASIINCCQEKISDLMVLLLGSSNPLNYDK